MTSVAVCSHVKKEVLTDSLKVPPQLLSQAEAVGQMTSHLTIEHTDIILIA